MCCNIGFCYTVLANGSILLPTVAPAASTLSKEEQDRLAMPPPPAPQVSVSSGGEGAEVATDAGKRLDTPLANTIGAGEFCPLPSVIRQ